MPKSLKRSSKTVTTVHRLQCKDFVPEKSEYDKIQIAAFNKGGYLFHSQIENFNSSFGAVSDIKVCQQDCGAERIE